MKIRIVTSVLFGLLISSAQLVARGDKVIPQIADGVNAADGTSFRTKIDIMNLGPFDSITGDQVKLRFFLPNGSPWVIATDLGTASEFPINLAPFETMRIQTSGTAPLAAGYALISNLASDAQLPNFSEDFEVSPSVFYEIRRGADVIDTVSVPIGQRTVHWQFPVEIDLARKLLSGLAIVNLSGETNKITFNLFRSNRPAHSTPDAVATLDLKPHEQIARFLHEAGLFTTLTTFKGVIEGFATQPVATLTLLQTPTSTGVQYATLVPAYIDSLRRDTHVYLAQGYPLDLDLMKSDYYADVTDPQNQDSGSWDLVYEPVSGATPHLKPVSGAQAAVVGILDDSKFDALSLDTLQNLTYSLDPIDMSSSSPNLTFGFTIAVRTNLGQYAKIRLINGLSKTSPVGLDLILEAYLFK